MQSPHLPPSIPHTAYRRPPRRPRPFLVLLNWRLRTIYKSLRTGPRRRIPPIPIIPTLNACAPPLPRASQLHHRCTIAAASIAVVGVPYSPHRPWTAFAAPIPPGFDLPEPGWLTDLDQLFGPGGFDPATLESFAAESSTAASQSHHQQPRTCSTDFARLLRGGTVECRIGSRSSIPEICATARDIRPGSDLCRSDVRIRTRHKSVLHCRTPLVHTHCTGDLCASWRLNPRASVLLLPRPMFSHMVVTVVYQRTSRLPGVCVHDSGLGLISQWV